MKLDLAYVGHTILRQKAHNVKTLDESILTLIAHMKETVTSYHALGLAAPQVGVSLTILVACFPQELPDGSMQPEEPRVFINPVLKDPSQEMWIADEGCLSIPKLFAPVVRPVAITVTAMNEQGETFTERLTGWPAKIIMHENDHLNGTLFIDRLSQKEKDRVANELLHLKKHYKSANEHLKLWHV